MKYLALFPLFILSLPAYAQDWSIGVGYTGTNFDHELFGFGAYVHADHRLAGDLFGTLYFSWHTKSQEDEIVKIREDLLAVMTGPVYAFELGGRVAIYSSLMFGLESWRVSGEARHVRRGSVDVSDTQNLWASQITIGLRVAITERFSADVSSAYRSGRLVLHGEHFLLDGFLWQVGTVVKF